MSSFLKWLFEAPVDPRIRYDVKPDAVFARDWVFEYSMVGVLAPSISLRANMPAVYDQLVDECSSSVAAVAALVEYDSMLQVKPNLALIQRSDTRLQDDTGHCIRDVFHAIKAHGVYDTNHTAWTKEYPEKFEYYRVYNDCLLELTRCIACGFPVALLLSVFSGFESIGARGLIPDPVQSAQPLGAQAVVVVGYDNDAQLLCIRHSRGTSWGDGGYGYISYKYLRAHAKCFWIVRNKAFDEDASPEMW